MKPDDLRMLLTSTWADPVETVAQRIFRADCALPLLCCDLDWCDVTRCAAIAVNVAQRKRGSRSTKHHAITLEGTRVFVRRADDVPPDTLVALVGRNTEVRTVEALMRGKRAYDRVRRMDTKRESEGWRV